MEDKSDRFERLKKKLLKSHYQDTYEFAKARLEDSNIFIYGKREGERKKMLRKALKDAGFDTKVVNGGRAGWLYSLTLCGVELNMCCITKTEEAYLGLGLQGLGHLFISVDRNLPERLKKLTKEKLLKMLKPKIKNGITTWNYQPYHGRTKEIVICYREDLDEPTFS